MLTQSQFDVLVYLENIQGRKVTQSKLSKTCFLSMGSTNKIISDLKELKYIIETQRSHYEVTKQGYACLEPYRVKRAVLIAAGFGSRLIPITLNTAKPLVKVHNKRIIETLLDALIEKGIHDIYIVRGYLGEQFDCLLKKYPSIKLFTNAKFNTENNISSAMLVKDKYENAYVMDADLYLKNKDIIRKYEYKSNYLGVPVNKTDDWRFVIKNKKAVGMKMGGIDCYQMIGISYWTQEDAKHFNEDILSLYSQPAGREKYWDDVVLGEYNANYDISIRPCSFEDIVEIDTFEELKQVDPIYAQ